MADVPSRLSDGNIYYRGQYIPIAEYREMITARSLYNLNNEYENTQLFSRNGQSNLAQSISTVLTVIPQYNRMQVNTNLLGNTYDAFRDEGSALAKIGLVMLGKQMAYNSAMNLAVKYVPTINLSQALKGGKIFKSNEDNTITVQDKDSEEYTFGDKVSNFASNFLGIDTYDVFGNANPFNKKSTNIDYIKNTGAAQLTHFYQAINMNIYKPVNYQSNSDFSKTFIDYSEKAGVTIDSARGSILRTQPTFTFDKQNIYPYLGIKIDSTAVSNANLSMDISYSAITDNIQEYAPTIGYVLDNFGNTVVERTKGLKDYVADISNFSGEGDSKNNLVWGRDGVGAYAEAEIGQLRGDVDSADSATEEEGLNFDKLKAKKGLLEYTRNLLNATSGRFVDITRKAFKKGDNIVGFQGSPLWKAPSAAESTYADESGTADKTGVRQHTILDQYGNDTTELEGTIGFAKSIRFKGNIVYNGDSRGNQNSVIYKTVLPRIHPTRDDDGGINNRNLMFSIENLAIGTIKRDKFGVIDDEYGTPIPLSEVGPFAGRQMWFPPYNIEINEVAAAKYESTVMVGRNEPMYNYMNSERSAVLSFSLLIDYPEQLRNNQYIGQDKNKAIADFFAFGGSPLPPESQVENIEEKINKLKLQLERENGFVEQAEPPEIDKRIVTVYFQNDRPTSGETNTIIQTMYDNPEHYEIMDEITSAQDGNGFGLNNEIYFRTGLTKISTGVWELTGTSDQYTSTGRTDQLGPSKLNKNLFDFYGNPETRKYYDIEITGSASKLYLSANERAYNEALGKRRVDAAKKLVVSRLTAMFGASVANEIATNNIQTFNVGSDDGSTEGAEADNMHLRKVKEERRASIAIGRNKLPIDKKEQKLNTTQETNRIKIQQEIQTLELQLSIAKNNIQENIYKKRNKAVLNSFESISGNQYYPAFHSQTPEDFHRRLTFLQQCTRQGAAKRYDIVDENTGELRARNSVFGKQPICILRVGDFFYTKVVIETVTIDYTDAPWDMNPEGFGMQPMMANVTLNMKVIGGQSLSGPIDALQNAVSFNYYANSNFTDKEMYNRPAAEAIKQQQYMFGVNGDGGIVGKKTSTLNAAYDALLDKNNVREGEQ